MGRKETDKIVILRLKKFMWQHKNLKSSYLLALELRSRKKKFVFSNKAHLYRSFFPMVRIDVYRRERVLVVSTSDARFIWWNGAERAGLFFCLGSFEIYSGLVEILFMSRAVSLMQSKVGNIKFFMYVYSFSGYYCFYQTKHRPFSFHFDLYCPHECKWSRLRMEHR